MYIWSRLVDVNERRVQPTVSKRTHHLSSGVRCQEMAHRASDLQICWTTGVISMLQHRQPRQCKPRDFQHGFWGYHDCQLSSGFEQNITLANSQVVLSKISRLPTLKLFWAKYHDCQLSSAFEEYITIANSQVVILWHANLFTRSNQKTFSFLFVQLQPITSYPSPSRVNTVNSSLIWTGMMQIPLISNLFTRSNQKTFSFLFVQL